MPNEDNNVDEFEVEGAENEVIGFQVSDDAARNFFLGKDLDSMRTDQPLLEHGHYRIPSPSKNIAIHLPGSKGRAKNAKSELKFLTLFVDDKMIRNIFQCTNEEIIRSAPNYLTPQIFVGTTNEVEVRAMIGLLIMAGVLKDSNLNLDDFQTNLVFLSLVPQ